MSKELREEALKLASENTVLRAKVEVGMINAAPDEMLPMLIDQTREQISKSKAMLAITDIMSTITNIGGGQIRCI